MPTTTFNKRIYTLPTFIANISDLFRHMDDLIVAVRQRRVNKAFAEKIMLAVTSVNRCRYCAFFHTHKALRAGVAKAELQQVMAHTFDELPQDEVVALAFAQHVAEHGGKVNNAAWQRIVDYYGPEIARDIMAYIRAIMFGNLLGNSFDAFLSRLIGRPAPGSKPLAEMTILVLAVVGVPAGVAVWALSRLARSCKLACPGYFDCQISLGGLLRGRVVEGVALSGWLQMS